MTYFSTLAQRLMMLALVTLLTAGAVLAQESITAPRYEAWRATASRAEEALLAGRASNLALENLRSEIVNWRDEFQQAQSVNKARITTIRSQLDTLGPVPEDGAEDEEIAALRTQLTTELARLNNPVVTAEAAYSRANGLISEIDKIIRDRQTDELISLGPSPLNPAYWNTSLQRFLSTVRGIANEVRNAWNSPVQRAEFREDLPISIPLFLFGLVLTLRGRGWASRLHLKARNVLKRGHGVVDFITSLGKIILPLIGLFALAEAIFATGLLGLRGTIVVSELPVLGLFVLVTRWLLDRILPDESLHRSALLELAPEQRPEARWEGTILSLLVVMQALLVTLGGFEGYSPETMAVLSFPLLLATCLVLFRAAQFLPRTMPENEDGVELSMRYRILRILSRAALAVALIGPALAAIGYGTAAAALVYPFVISLAVLGGVLVLQNLTRDIYALVVGADDTSEALMPVLVGFLLTLAALPILALVWGARVADLTELWTRFREGFTLGDSRISPVDFLTFALVFALGYMLTRMVQGALRSSVLPRTKIDPGGQNAIVAGMGYVGIFLAALVAISSAGIDLSSIAIVAGALSVGIGFGLQNIVQNFVSGIILLIERPITEGDWIEVGGQMGYVRDISVRSTRIETFDRTDVIVPNGDLVSGVVTNWTRGKTIGRVIVPVGVAYGTDTRKVESVLLEIAKNHPMVLMNPAPYVVMQRFGADSLDFEIRAILRDVNWVLSVKSDMNHEIAKRFAEEGIEIPFGQRDIWLRNPEALWAATQTATPAGQRPIDAQSHLSSEDAENGEDGAGENGDADGGGR